MKILLKVEEAFKNVRNRLISDNLLKTLLISLSLASDRYIVPSVIQGAII